MPHGFYITLTLSILFTSDLKVGQYVLSLIEEVKNEGRVVRLSLNPQAVNKAVAGTQQGWTLDSLLPGLLIRVHIKRVRKQRVKKPIFCGSLVHRRVYSESSDYDLITSDFFVLGHSSWASCRVSFVF